MEEIPLENKAVFITGCDSGFGYLLAQRLDSKGLHVFAGCLFPSGSGARELQSLSSNRLKVVQLDVTDNESVKKAFEFVKNSLEDSKIKLWSIVNNAGIGVGLSADLSSMDDFKKSIDVNCLGVVRVTKAFLPLLKRSRGRIVTVTSMAGRISSQLKTPYTVSKFAAVGFSDSLRLELNIWGIKVISVEPHFFKTPIIEDKRVDAMFDSVLKSLEPEKRKRYGDRYFEELRELTKESYRSASPKIDLVLKALESAVCLKYPMPVYSVAPDFKTQLRMDLLLLMPRKWQDFFVRQFNRNNPKPLFLK